MKTIFISFLTLLSVQLFSQEDFALKVWNDSKQLGINTQTFGDTCSMPELRLGLQNDVSSIEVGPGYRVEFYAREDHSGIHNFTVDGPVRIGDLSTIPMNSSRGNWNDAIASFRIVKSPFQKEILAQEN